MFTVLYYMYISELALTIFEASKEEQFCFFGERLPLACAPAYSAFERPFRRAFGFMLKTHLP